MPWKMGCQSGASRPEEPGLALLPGFGDRFPIGLDLGGEIL
jgi:hypothetical protein